MRHHDDAIALLIMTPLAVTLGYLAVCAVWPFAACPRCHGLGKHLAPSGRAWRYCRRCHGTGTRTRTGRWIWNQIRTRTRTR